MAIDAPHQARRLAGYQRKQAQAQHEKGLLIVYTGAGKGKTTAAFGMALRAIAHGFHIGVVQFIKSDPDAAECKLLSRFAQVDFHVAGAGCTWQSEPQLNLAAAQRGWMEVERMLDDPRYHLLLLDELNLALKYRYLDEALVLERFAQRRPQLHIVVTGRHAPAALLQQADLVSEVRALKHPYREQGVKAQPGIEF